MGRPVKIVDQERDRMARDPISEILERRSRGGAERHAYDFFAARFEKVQKLADSMDSIKDEDALEEIMRHLPVAMIDALEGFVRKLLADIINIDDKARKSVKKLDLRLNLEWVISIHDKEISLGEFISHMISVNKIKDIADIMCVLLDIGDYSDYLRSHVVNLENTVLHEYALFDEGIPNSAHKDKSWTGMTYDECESMVSRAFQTRHILAHEFGFGVDLNPELISKMLTGVVYYASAMTLSTVDRVPLKFP